MEPNCKLSVPLTRKHFDCSIVNYWRYIVENDTSFGQKSDIDSDLKFRIMVKGQKDPYHEDRALYV